MNYLGDIFLFIPVGELGLDLKETSTRRYLYRRAERRLATRANLRRDTIISLGVRTRGFGLPVKQAISSSCYVTSARLGQHLMSRLVRSCALLSSLSLSLSLSLSYTHTRSCSLPSLSSVSATNPSPRLLSWQTPILRFPSASRAHPPEVVAASD